MNFSVKDFFSKCDPIRNFPADLVTFTEEILNGKIYFLCSVKSKSFIAKSMEIYTEMLLFKHEDPSICFSGPVSNFDKIGASLETNVVNSQGMLFLAYKMNSYVLRTLNLPCSPMLNPFKSIFYICSP